MNNSTLAPITNDLEVEKILNRNFFFSGPGDYQHCQGAHVAEGEEEGGPGDGRGLL